MRLARLILALALFAVPALSFAQQVPQRLGYEGRLLKADGTPETGSIDITFAIYDAETLGKVLWSETRKVALSDGFYSVYLGDVTPFPAGLFDGSDRFLELTVATNVLSPRQRIASVAYALTAGEARGTSGGTVKASSVEVNGKTIIDANGQLDPAAGGAFAPKSHTHDAADVVSGTLDVKRVPQGPGSTLDADTVDGKHAADLAAKAHVHDGADITTGTIAVARVTQGPGSGLDADTVDGKHAADLAAKAHVHDGADITTGKIAVARITQGPGSGLDADTLDGQSASAFALSSDLSTAGTVNSGTNPVDWTKLKGVPAALASCPAGSTNYVLRWSGTAWTCSADSAADASITTQQLAPSVTQALVPPGSMMMFAAATAPAGYLLCDGRAVSRTTYAALFAVIGTTYGAGDGSTTFNLPDLRQRFPLGLAAAGTGSTLGGTGGAIDHLHVMGTHTHTLPAHYHSKGTLTEASAGDHNHGLPGGDYFLAGPSGGFSGANLTLGGGTYTIFYNTGNAGAHTHVLSGNVGNTGGVNGDASMTSGANASANTGTANPPFVVVNYIIKY